MQASWQGQTTRTLSPLKRARKGTKNVSPGHPPEEEDVNRDGADVPDGMGVQDPEERWEVKQLEQG